MNMKREELFKLLNQISEDIIDSIFKDSKN